MGVNLDRRIAELKGWEWDERERMVWTDPPYETVKMGEKTTEQCGLIMSACCWSTSDAKALELVDELVTFEDGWTGFEILTLSVTNGYRWRAGFLHREKEWLGVGHTRPEAICRAYIAAVDWMKAGKA